MTETTDRLVGCRRIHNFRDYGGYTTPHGRLRRGRLFRSAQHVDADAVDLAKVGELSLGTVIDLRSRTERGSAPCPRPDGFDAEVILLDNDAARGAPHIEAARGAMNVDEARAAMIRTYRSIPFDPVLTRVYARYLATLSETDRSTLIHCVAGKDRTGIAVALFHHLVGVHHHDLMANYLLTNMIGNIEARVRGGGARVKAMFGDMSDNALRAMMSVEPAYLDSSFAAIAENYGNLDTYLHVVLGVSPAMREQIVARLV